MSTEPRATRVWAGQKPFGTDPARTETERRRAVESLFIDLEVVVRDCEYDPTEAAPPLDPLESESIRYSVEARRRDFAFGRTCARGALEDLGFKHPIIPASRDGAPVWPPDVTGSITHKGGYCLAVATEKAWDRFIGIDAEFPHSVPPELEALVMSTGERRRLDGPIGSVDRHTATLAFSAKEAFYKAQYQLSRRWVGFKDIEASWSGETRTQGRMRWGCIRLDPASPLAESLGVVWPVETRWWSDGRLIIVGASIQPTSST